MTVETLIKYCLQFLEQDGETDVMDESMTMSELLSNDTFSEYTINIQHSIYMGLVRYATSNILPLVEYQVENVDDKHSFYLTNTGTSSGRRLFHKIQGIYALDKNNEYIPNIKFVVLGNKIILREYDENCSYFVLYRPTVYSLEYYKEKQNTDDIYSLELTSLYHNLVIPDEMAINIKYLVYSDMKIEENPSMANYCKNYFETYLGEMQNEDIDNNQIDSITTDWGDRYGD